MNRSSEERESFLKGQEESLELYLSRLDLGSESREQIANIFLARVSSYLQKWLKYRDTGVARQTVSVSEHSAGERDFLCSFCQTSYREVGPLVEGPSDVNICERCVEVSQMLINEDKKKRTAGKGVVEGRTGNDKGTS